MPSPSKWRNWTPKTPSHGTDNTDSIEVENRETAENSHSVDNTVSIVSTVTSHIQPAPGGDQNRSTVNNDDIRERFEERAAIAESEGGLSRIDAELAAYDQVKMCVQCRQETAGEGNAVRVARGG